MVQITFIDSGGAARTVEGEAGATVMETAIKNAVPEIEAECGGACACSTCHVYVDEAWREKVGGPSPMEEDMLDFAYNVQPNSRLRPVRSKSVGRLRGGSRCGRPIGTPRTIPSFAGAAELSLPLPLCAG